MILSLEQQKSRFGHAWDHVPSFGGPMDWWDFYEEAVKRAPAGSTIVELGCYHGRSLLCLGLLAREANKSLRLVGIDDGSAAHQPDMEIVRRNIEPVADLVHLIAGDSAESARSFKDDSCWMVFIDSGHLHHLVEADVLAWMPKLSRDGWLCGHDLRAHTVGEVIWAMFGDRMIYDPRWHDIFMVPKCEPDRTKDIRGFVDLAYYERRSW